ncbi:MAG TPA: uroporphyrinogen-III synthase [Pusillimonas sp.]|nr:uroporphyrinogen-III synthase [Pusillimonas sp.]|tara:strand:- start:246062 stop:246883 length:822 start_codon:yes stop_codon:yes gene_type:complete
MSGRPRSCIVLTRPAGRNQILSASLRGAGFTVLDMPVLAVSALPYDVQSFVWPNDYQLMVFVSANAVDFYVARLKAMTGGDTQADFSGVTLAAVGPSTASRLRNEPLFRSVRVVVPTEGFTFDSEGLLATLEPDLPSISKAVIVRGQAGRNWLAEQLSSRGIRVDRYAVYQRHPVSWSDTSLQALKNCVHDGGKLTVLLTSSEAVDAFCANLKAGDLAYLLGAMRFVVIHDRIAARLQSQLRSIPDAQVMPGVKLCTPDDESMLRTIMLSATL